MSDPADIQRLIGDVVRVGTVASIDLAAGTCCVRIGDLLTNDLPWLAPRAGAMRAWLPPSIGEQVLLLSPEGDTEASVVVGGLSSDTHPAPSSADVALLSFDDAAAIGYDPVEHHLSVVLPAGATVEIVAPGGVKLIGDVEIIGKLDVRDDVKAGAISVQHHLHGQVQAGTAKSGVAE